MSGRKINRRLSRSYGSIYKDDTTSQATVLSIANTFFDVVATTSLGPVSGVDFSQPSNGIIQYDGATRMFRVMSSSSLFSATQPALEVTLSLDGTPVSDMADMFTQTNVSMTGYAITADLELSAGNQLTMAMRDTVNTDSVGCTGYFLNLFELG